MAFFNLLSLLSVIFSCLVSVAHAIGKQLGYKLCIKGQWTRSPTAQFGRHRDEAHAVVQGGVSGMYLLDWIGPCSVWTRRGPAWSRLLA